MALITSGARVPADCTACPAGLICVTNERVPRPCPEGEDRNQRDDVHAEWTGVGYLFGCAGGPPDDGLTAAGCAENRDGSSCKLSCKLTRRRCSAGLYCPGMEIGANRTTRECPTGTYCPGDRCGNNRLISPSRPAILCRFIIISILDDGSLRTHRSTALGLSRALAAPLNCAPGSYNNLTAQGSCPTCPGGVWCEERSLAYDGNICPVGYYCPPGTGAPTQFPCPAGTYSSVAGLADLSACVPCTPGMYSSIPGGVTIFNSIALIHPVLYHQVCTARGRRCWSPPATASLGTTARAAPRPLTRLRRSARRGTTA